MVKQDSTKNTIERQGILSIGNLLVDKMLRCDEFPQESMLTMIQEIHHSCGGGVSNVLFDLARMDPTLPLAMSGIVGNDDAGQFILAHAKQYGIDTSRVTINQDSVTSFTDVMINNNNGYRTFFHYMGANALLDYHHFTNLNSQARIVHVAYMLLLPRLERQIDNTTTGARALAELKKQGFEVALDLVSSPDEKRYQQWIAPVLPFVDYLIINDEEAKRLTQPDQDYLQQATQLLDMGVNELVCIHYPQGAVAMTKQGEQQTVTAYHVADQHVVSTLGAGDAFCAGLLYALHQGWPLQDALKLGCASAHFNLFSVSATDGAPELAQLQQLINSKRKINDIPVKTAVTPK